MEKLYTGAEVLEILAQLAEPTTKILDSNIDDEIRHPEGTLAGAKYYVGQKDMLRSMKLSFETYFREDSKDD